MSSLSAALPAPVHNYAQEETPAPIHMSTPDAPVMAVAKKGAVPSYRHRRGWLPRSLEDYGDGGAFPEIHVAQYPADMGRKREGAVGTIALRVDESGKVRYDAIARRGHAEDRIIHSSLSDLKPMDVKEGDPTWQRPSDEQIRNTTEETRAALEKIIDGKIKAGQPKHIGSSSQQQQPTYIKYTPQSKVANADSNGPSTRIIRVVEAPVDPMEPPKFKLRKVPKGSGSPPPPVMHSPPRKVNPEDAKQWVIPPCISNWKNPKGYTIPLDKRLAADGRGLQEVTINDNFAKFAEALYIADRQAREEVTQRAQMQKKLAQKEKETKEEHLRKLAQQAREERAGLMESEPAGAAAADSSDDERHDRRRPSRRNEDDEDDAGFRERERLRQDRHRDIQRQMRTSRMKAETKGHSSSMADRDVSEKIALGMVAPTAAKGGEAMYDQRLFRGPEGVSSGFRDDEAYNLYDKPLFTGASSGLSGIYRPKGTREDDVDVDYEGLVKGSDRFVRERGGHGLGHSASGEKTDRDGPVEFEKEEDPFGVDKFLSEARKGKRAHDGGEGDDRKRARD